MDERTRNRLTQFLGSLPPEHARALARCVESLDAGSGIPRGLILDALQPLLNGGDARPVPTPEERFALPFADLLVEARSVKRRGRIARASAAAVWSWLSGSLPAALPGIAGHGAADATQDFPEPDFHEACARILAAALADDARRAALAARLGGEDGLEDARDITAVLEIAADALEIRERFPRPVPALTAADLNSLVVMFDDFADRNPGRAVWFFLLLSGRLERPWDVLPVMEHVAGRVHGGRLRPSDSDAVMESLFAELDERAEFFRRLNTSVFDPAEVAAGLKAFTRMVEGFSRAGIPAGGRWARRMMTCRSVVAEKMEILMERAPRDILAALPVHRIGRFGRVRRRPDLGAGPDPARAGKALRMATLLDVARAHAADAAFKAAWSEAAADTREGLHEYAGALLEEMKRLDADEAARAQAWLDLVLALTQRAVGPEEAGRLRRDAAALDAGGLPDVAVS